MTTIRYFSLSENTLSAKPGDILEVDELIHLALSERSRVPEEISDLQHLTEKDVDPKGLQRPTKWEGLMTLLVWALSNRVPSRQDVLRGRQILMSLPKNLKRGDQLNKLTFSFLPYLLTGFKSHIENRFQANSNCVESMKAFVHKLSTENTPVFESFLCAHRGKGGPERFYLVDNICHPQAEKALHLMKGLMANNPWSGIGSIQWFQQGPTEFAGLNMFPEMFLRYLESGEIANLLTRLGRHFTQVSQLDSAPMNGVGFQLNDSDTRSHHVLRFMCEMYGEDWRHINYESSRFANDPVVQVALTHTQPLMLRQMPFYKSPEIYKCYMQRKRQLILHNQNQNSEASSLITSDLVESSIERFFEMQNMQLGAKALYETVFYYLWGMIAQESGIFSIGIDRDHEKFQNEAWVLGSQSIHTTSQDEPTTNSLLYARRNAEKKDSGLLRDFSIRQFWR